MQDLKQETNHNLLIEDIEKQGPYTVCFYYYDLNQKVSEIYKRKIESYLLYKRKNR